MKLLLHQLRLTYCRWSLKYHLDIVCLLVVSMLKVYNVQNRLL